MERIIADLELDIKEIKYLLKMRVQEPDFSLIAHRRVKDMQAHLTELLSKIEGETLIPVNKQKEQSIPEKKEEIKQELKPVVEPEPVVEQKPVVEPEPIIKNEPASEPERITEPGTDVETEYIGEPEAIIEILEEETVTVEFADDEQVDTEKVEKKEKPEVELTTFTTESILGERLKPSASIIKSMSLNDTFRFSGELFAGDTEKMHNMLQQISEMDNFGNVMTLLAREMNVDEENECFNDFVNLLKKYFS